eukprot:COSAG02_NODE_10102_length_2023_cov_1.260395_1_plen_21_part_10
MCGVKEGGTFCGESRTHDTSP